MRSALVPGIVAALLLAGRPAGAAPACTADGVFMARNGAQAWSWTLQDRNGAVSGTLLYLGSGGPGRARVAGKRVGSTLRLTLTDAAGGAHKALAGVTCSRPTPLIPVDEILFVRVAGPVPHVAFYHRHPGSDAGPVGRLPSAPPPGGLPGWLAAMSAVAR